MPEEDIPTVFKATVDISVVTDTKKSYLRTVDVVYRTNANPDKNKMYSKIMKLALQKVPEQSDVR
jgi:hypothetical protein